MSLTRIILSTTKITIIFLEKKLNSLRKMFTRIKMIVASWKKIENHLRGISTTEKDIHIGLEKNTTEFKEKMDDILISSNTVEN